MPVDPNDMIFKLRYDSVICILFQSISCNLLSPFHLPNLMMVTSLLCRPTLPDIEHLAASSGV